MAKASRAMKSVGRGKGNPNKDTGVLRLQKKSFWTSEGFCSSLEALATVMGESQADALHEAVRQLAIRKLSTPQHVALIKTI